MIKFSKKIMCILVLLLNFGIVTSCDRNTEPVDDNIYLEHLILRQRNDGYYQIIGLTEKGEQAKTLIFPSLYNGIPVIGVGIVTKRMGFSQFDSIDEYYYGYVEVPNRMDISNTETIYFCSHHGNRLFFENQSDNFKKCVYMNDLYFNRDIMPELPTLDYGTPYFTWGSDKNINVFSKKEYEKIDDVDKGNCVSANIEFYYNITASDERLYWIDYEKHQTLIFEPPFPTLEGREFVGWYTEPECINKWDFNENMIEESTDLNNMVQLKLYAKWK